MLPDSMVYPQLISIADPSVKLVSASDVVSSIAKEISHCSDKQLLIYLHIPFCSTKCTFCDWVTDIPVAQLRSGPSVRKQYVEALGAQIRAIGPQLEDMGYDARYIYWGGGTPSKLEADELIQVMAALNESFDLSRIDEHTMETSPETLTLDKLRTVRSFGINRISMGVQSFDDKELRKAARGHSAKEAEDAVGLIRQAGFKNLNLDLIIAFPDQQLETVEKTFQKTIELDPDHVTVYIYRPVPETVMGKQINDGHRKASSLKQMFDYYNLSKFLLEEAGYFEYSIGYFAKNPESVFKGEEYYFTMRGDYIGFGSGASSIVGHHSLRNQSGNLHQFIQNPTHFEFCEKFSPEKIEETFPTLRLTMTTDAGINYANFKRLFGFDFSEALAHPSIKGLMSYYRYCGTDFKETEESLYVTEESKRASYIMSFLTAYVPLKESGAKLDEAFKLIK